MSHISAEVRLTSKANAKKSTPDGDAFLALYESHFDFVFRNAVRLSGSRTDAEDLTHETFLLAQQKLQEPTAIRSTRGWLFSLLFGLVNNHKRSLRRRAAVTDIIDTSTESSTPESQLLEREQLRAIARALSTLSLEQQAVFIMMEIEGMSAPEIAGVLNVPVNTVYSRQRVAKLACEDAIDDSEDSTMIESAVRGFVQRRLA